MTAFKRHGGWAAKFTLRGEQFLGIPLRRRDGSVRGWALIDEEDKALADSVWSWQHGYASRKMRNDEAEPKRRLYLHREVMGVRDDPSVEIDHINRDRLDNRRANLRVCAEHRLQSQNLPAQRGSGSRYRGVSLAGREGKWAAVVKLNYKNHHLGRFDTEEEAAAVAAAFRAKHMPFSEDARKAA